MTWNHDRTAHQRGYTKAWRRLSEQVRAEQPICAVPGCDRPTAQADHIIPKSERPDLLLVRDNVQGLCQMHHSRKTGREGGLARQRNRPSRKRPPEKHPGML